MATSSAYTYTPQELNRMARKSCKGLGRYQSWGIRITMTSDGREATSLVVYYRDKSGQEHTSTARL